jgi:DNA-binding response OmpR family regulator
MMSVLIVEDNLLIADGLETMLIWGGYSVCGIASTVAEAVVLANTCRPDLAVLDLRLKYGELGSEIIPLLTECGRIGILYTTGNDDMRLTKADGDVCLRKPYQFRDVVESLEVVKQIVRGEAITSSVPSTARVLQ